MVWSTEAGDGETERESSEQKGAWLHVPGLQQGLHVPGLQQAVQVANPPGFP